MNYEKTILGIMSGSSLDGIDLAIVRFQQDLNGIQWEYLATGQVPFEPRLQSTLQQAPNLTAKALFDLESDFNTFCGRMAVEFIAKKGIAVEGIASHGHTIFHEPDRGYSIQIGNGGVLAALTGLPCMTDFRASDVALGGQGAPLAPVVEKHLFDEWQYFINLGGIANISSHGDDNVIAFDICPCNQILNYIAGRKGMPYDKGGAMAARGSVIGSLVKKWSSLDYFSRSHPKSLDNSWVRDHFFDDLVDPRYDILDLARTAVEFITQQVSHAIVKTRDFHPTAQPEVVTTGGGTHNLFLVERLRKALLSENFQLHVPSMEIIDYKEALLMAFMGFLRMTNQENTLPSVTGASGPSRAGALYIP